VPTELEIGTATSSTDGTHLTDPRDPRCARHVSLIGVTDPYLRVVGRVAAATLSW
jgi:hypothetical protein